MAPCLLPWQPLHHGNVAVAGIITGVVAHVLPLQKHVDLPEGGARSLVSVPAFPHQVEDLPWAGSRLWQARLARVYAAVELAAVLDHLQAGRGLVNILGIYQGDILLR